MAEDVGYLSNKLMALEIGIGLAHLGDRTLSLPVDSPIGWGPRPALDGVDAGTASSLRDLFDLPVEVLGDDEYDQLVGAHPVLTVDWPDLYHVAYADPPERRQDEERVAAFANGRPTVAFDPDWADAPILDLPARGLASYSYFFHLTPDRRREVFSRLEQIRPKRPYRELASSVAADLGRFNAAHIRRTDHLVGVPDYRRVTPWMIRDNLAAVLPSEERLVVCTEADPDSDVFKPLRAHFGDVVFLSQHLLDDPVWRARFAELERHDDSTLALITQEVAARADRFVGTFASTFTGIIHRRRHLADGREPFMFTADFLGGGTRFERCTYEPIVDGPFTWNRLGYPVDPAALAWMREWPEARLEDS
jgi:hypothetical protein